MATSSAKRKVSRNADFNALSEAEQRIVAERLLKIEESGWKPFWCKDPHCDGDPHWEVDELGNNTFIPEGHKTTKPLGEFVYEDENGNLWYDDEVDPLETDTPIGRPVLDPQWAHNHAREDQRLPSWKKAWTLFIMSGRGAGKTTTGVEFVTLSARKGLDGAIVGRRGTELENTHVATIIARAHPEFVPEYKSSKDILVWPNGAITYLFSAERPENIRSVNLSYVWLDEAAHMDEIKKAWDNAKFAARVKSPGNPIHMLITSTPTPTPWVMAMEDNPKVIVRRVSTYANKKNLDKEFMDDLRADYEGTRIGRQELHGEVLRDVEGALWNDDLFKHARVDEQEFDALVDSLDLRIVSIDPAGSANKRSDLTGIIAGGTHYFDEKGDYLPAATFEVLLDATLKADVTGWARQAFKAAQLIRAHKIVAEKNFGGNMVKQVLTDFAKTHPEESKDENGEDFIIEVLHAEHAKETRAEGSVGKYEQGRVTHVTSPIKIATAPKGSRDVGDLSLLEKEQVGWVPKSRGGRMPSPNRIDALVWLLRELESKMRFVANVASQASVMAKMKKQPNRVRSAVSGNQTRGMGNVRRRKSA